MCDVAEMEENHLQITVRKVQGRICKLKEKDSDLYYRLLPILDSVNDFCEAASDRIMTLEHTKENKRCCRCS